MEDSLKQCSTTCANTIEYCLEKGGIHADPAHINLLQDCEDICMLAASFMQRNSQYSERLCALAAEICERCAESCEALSDDQVMMKCAEHCRKCAEDCRNMAVVE